MTSAQEQRFTSQALKFAACMRAHGITEFQYSQGERLSRRTLLGQVTPPAFG